MAGSDIINRADIAVIGGGIIGASIAFQLTARSKAWVTLIDQYPPLGGMSGRTFGQIRHHYSNALMVQLALRGFEVLRAEEGTLLTRGVWESAAFLLARRTR